MEIDIMQKQFLCSGGTQFQLIGGAVNINQTLEANIYEVRTPPMQPTMLVVRQNVDLTAPEKVFGKIPKIVEKTYAAFDRRSRNTGLLLSGNRGMGKTLCIRLVMQEAVKRGYPIIVLDRGSEVLNAINLLNQITQPVVVIMDEFEKVFQVDLDDDGDREGDGAQTPFLSMLDGIGVAGKKLFVASINNSHRISKFLLNRPGRFYYHYEFNSLSFSEMVDYLRSRVTSMDEKKIKYAASVLQTYEMNYDGMSAIADELNAGYDIAETIRDLNLDRNGFEEFSLAVKLNDKLFNGHLRNYSISEMQEIHQMDLSFNADKYVYADHDEKRYLSNGYIGNHVELTVDPSRIVLNDDGIATIPSDAIKRIYLYDSKLSEENGSSNALVSHFSSVSNIELLPTKASTRAIYMDL